MITKTNFIFGVYERRLPSHELPEEVKKEIDRLASTPLIWPKTEHIGPCGWKKDLKSECHYPPCDDDRLEILQKTHHFPHKNHLGGKVPFVYRIQDEITRDRKTGEILERSIGNVTVNYAPHSDTMCPICGADYGIESENKWGSCWRCYAN
ncbi:MAG: hypothetical protein WCJ29_00825 [bacterium]